MSSAIRCPLPVLLLMFVATAQSAPPLAAFARQEQIRAPQISPDGRYMVFQTSINGVRTAVVMDLQNPTVIVPALSPKRGANVDLSWCQWANDTRVLCGFRGTETIGADTYPTTQLAAADADGKNVKVLMQNDKFELSQARDRVLDMTVNEHDSVLIQAVEKYVGTGTLITHTDITPAIYRLNVYNGGIAKHMDAQAHMWGFYTDGVGEVRLATGFNETRLLYAGRLLGEDRWRMLAKTEAFEQTEGFVPLHVLAGTNRALAIAQNNGRDALWEIDLEDKLPPRLMFSHPSVDIGDFNFEEGTGKLLGYRYDTDRPFYQYEDERLASVMRGVNKAFPQTYNRVVSYSKDFKTLAIKIASDVDAGTYYLYKVDTRKMTELGRAYPELDSKQMGQMRSIEYKAQDGTTIPGYLTTPRDVRPEKLPLIVLPHGGPIDRDTWGFDFLVQFLVSRGYAVLQMNFRGSSGYGWDWFHAAHQDWGGLTYSDITDATRWSIEQGIADPNRICIVGWSFGGYAALLGAVRHSDLYKCSASIAGVSDIVQIYDEQTYNLDKKITRRQLGENRTKLKEDSPVRHVGNIKIPVLLVHGTRDATVNFRQSLDMSSALKAAKKQYKFVQIKDGDHNLWRQSERETMLRELEEFLNTHLKSAATP